MNYGEMAKCPACGMQGMIGSSCILCNGRGSVEVKDDRKPHERFLWSWDRSEKPAAAPSAEPGVGEKKL